MVSKYVLISTNELDERRIEHELEKHPHIVDVNPSISEETAIADPFFENYNVIIKVEADSMDNIHSIIEEVRQIKGIQDIKVYSKPTTT